MDLAQILNLLNLNQSDSFSNREILEILLTYDKWKTEATFSHELQLEEIRQTKGNSVKIVTSHSNDSKYSDEEIEFNKLTSYGACNEKHIGLMAKTKIWEGANNRSSKLLEAWYSHIQENNIITLKDLKDGRIKSLLLLFLWSSGCAYRAHKWPDASDAHFVPSVKKELDRKFSTFSKHSIVAAYESLKVFWKELNDYSHYPFNSSLISEILDEAYEYVGGKSAEEQNNDIKNSPLFVEFCKRYQNVDPKTLEKYYVKNRHNFVAAGVSALRKTFTLLPPKELEQKFSSSEWPKKWHIYLPSYESKWPEQIKVIVKETETQQQEWCKA